MSPGMILHDNTAVAEKVWLEIKLKFIHITSLL